MRQGQQNRRNRSRGRKPQNPLSRNHESNGPDVKIRGTASHVAEKYSALARDAFVSGDPVTAENYYQHAEHYNRIVMFAQSQHSPQSDEPQYSGSQDSPEKIPSPEDSALTSAANKQSSIENGDHEKKQPLSSETEKYPRRRSVNGAIKRESRKKFDTQNEEPMARKKSVQPAEKNVAQITDNPPKNIALEKEPEAEGKREESADETSPDSAVA